jgi:hypothetical protein
LIEDDVLLVTKLELCNPLWESYCFPKLREARSSLDRYGVTKFQFGNELNDVVFLALYFEHIEII